MQKRKENEATKDEKKKTDEGINYQRGIKIIFYMSKALVTAAVLPSASRAFRSDARRISSSSGEARGVRFFFLLSSRDDPLLSREHTHHHLFPQILFPKSSRGDEKTTTKRKKIKSSSLLLKKGRAFLPFFRRVDADIFFRAENISILLFFFLCFIP